MTIILKQDKFRNTRNDCTIIVQQFVEDSYNTPLWRYFVKYDRYAITSGCSDCLLTRPNKKWLQNRF